MRADHAESRGGVVEEGEEGWWEEMPVLSDDFSL